MEVDPFTPVDTSDPGAEEAARQLGRKAALAVSQAALDEMYRSLGGRVDIRETLDEHIQEEWYFFSLRKQDDNRQVGETYAASLSVDSRLDNSHEIDGRRALIMDNAIRQMQDFIGQGRVIVRVPQ
jgi:hypothetical protein